MAGDLRAFGCARAADGSEQDTSRFPSERMRQHRRRREPRDIRGHVEGLDHDALGILRSPQRLISTSSSR
jgi:hypothetical protein